MNPKLIVRDPQKNFFSKRKKEKEKLQFGYQSTYIAMVGVIIFLLMYYIWTLNVNATQWYEIRKLENIGKELKDDLNRLESTISEIESLNNIMGDDMYEEMQEASNPNYLVLRDDVQYVFTY